MHEKKEKKRVKKKEIRLKRQTGTNPLRPYRLDFGLYPEDNEKLLNVVFVLIRASLLDV